MKIPLIVGGIVVAIVVFGFFVPPPNGFLGGDKIPIDVIYDPLPIYDWEVKTGAEDVSKRTHISKDYAHPTDPEKRFIVQSTRILHYSEGGEFKDALPLPFPEGK